MSQGLFTVRWGKVSKQNGNRRTGWSDCVLAATLLPGKTSALLIHLIKVAEGVPVRLDIKHSLVQTTSYCIYAVAFSQILQCVSMNYTLHAISSFHHGLSQTWNKHERKIRRKQGGITKENSKKAHNQTTSDCLITLLLWKTILVKSPFRNKGWFLKPRNISILLLSDMHWAPEILIHPGDRLYIWTQMYEWGPMDFVPTFSNQSPSIMVTERLGELICEGNGNLLHDSPQCWWHLHITCCK